jgi:DNA-binding SARP family transcriptional activator
MMTISMLGTFSITVDKRRVTEELGVGGRMLAGYLFEFPDRAHRREKLADRFWGHLDPERARAALNTALWRIRRLLSHEPLSQGGENLRGAGIEVVLEIPPWLDIDTHRFGHYVRQALDPNVHQTELRIPWLESAADLYLGPFMEGDDADWILEERERLHSIYIRAGAELVRVYGSLQRFEEAIAVARRILSVDPFRESIHRTLSVLLVLSGQRVAALKHYDRLKLMFREELGIDPMPDTLRLGRDIRSGAICDRLDALKAGYFSTTYP